MSRQGGRGGTEFRVWDSLARAKRAKQRKNNGMADTAQLDPLSDSLAGSLIPDLVALATNNPEMGSDWQKYLQMKKCLK